MFTSKIKEIMKDKDVTIRDIVAVSGLSSATLHKARSDVDISECRLSTLGRIAHALDVPVKALFDGEYEPSSGKDKNEA
ncbi:MAG: helix-turn-helix transcriptional regulator [Desulfovibrio sp.]|jgi:DNA-binding Xre family transcriptional regulator|nr:helix-turn-helix transcriptional regulator [Desulfovibrio sp.]